MQSAIGRVEAWLRGGGAQDVLDIHSNLPSLITLAKERLRELQPISEFSVVLVDAKTYTDVNTADNSCSRYMDAKILVGPKKAEFSIEIDHEDSEGDLRTNIISTPNLISMDNSAAVSPKDSAIEEFLGKAGWEHAIAQSCNGMSDEDVANMTGAEMRRWVFADVVKIMIKHIAENKGYEDGCGVGLGIAEDDMYEWLMLR